MIELNDKHLLMIEPENPATEPVDDDLTEIARQIFSSAVSDNIRYRGWHTCICGARSDNNNWILPDGTITNSLMVHYIECHRQDIPESEIEKLKSKKKK